MKNYVLLMAAAAALLSGCQKNAGKVIVGTGQSYEPFCYKDSAGELSGFDIEVVREIDRRLPDIEVQFEVFEFKNVLVSLATGKIDVGAHEFEENPERRKTYLYGEEYYNDYNGYLAVKADGPWADVTSLEELAGNPAAQLAVSTGSNYEAYIRTWNETHGPDAQLSYISFDDDYVRNTNVATGKCAAIILTLFDLELYNIKTPGLNLKPVSEKPLNESKAYLLFKKGDVKLQSAFDGALREMKADGTLEEIKRRVFENYFDSL
jgi:L-cystine transport system substrate-binding protein